VDVSDIPQSIILVHLIYTNDNSIFQLNQENGALSFKDFILSLNYTETSKWYLFHTTQNSPRFMLENCHFKPTTYSSGHVHNYYVVRLNTGFIFFCLFIYFIKLGIITFKSCSFTDISFSSSSGDASFIAFWGGATVNFFDCFFKNLSGGKYSPLFYNRNGNGKIIAFSGCTFDILTAGTGYPIIHLLMSPGSSSFIFQDNIVKNIVGDISQTVNGTFLVITEDYKQLSFSGNSFTNISGNGAGGAISFENTKLIEISSCLFEIFFFFFWIFLYIDLKIAVQVVQSVGEVYFMERVSFFSLNSFI
jgi:hypothetical protein